MLIVRHHEIHDLLARGEREVVEVVEVVRAAYRRHDEGRSILPAPARAAR